MTSLRNTSGTMDSMSDVDHDLVIVEEFDAL